MPFNTRLETGVVKCDDDWAGVYIGGDDAVAYAHSLQQVIAAIEHTDNDKLKLSLYSCKGLQALLQLSNENDPGFKDVTVTHITLEIENDGK